MLEQLPALACEDLTVCYRGAAAPALDGLALGFARGRFTALVGPNGCGKSTLLKAIMGFLPPAAGRIMLDGKPIAAMRRRALARRIAYLPQDNHCPDYLSLAELVELGGYARYSLFRGPGEHDRALFRQALATVGLQGMAHVSVNALSGGQRQRAWIAMVLAQDADTILLDEPVNHLDLKYQYAVLGLVRRLAEEHGKTVVAVLHDLNLAAAFADEVAMLRDGRTIAAGATGAVMTDANVRDVFGLDAEVFEHRGRLVCLPRPGSSGDAA